MFFGGGGGGRLPVWMPLQWQQSMFLKLIRRELRVEKVTWLGLSVSIDIVSKFYAISLENAFLNANLGAKCVVVILFYWNNATRHY